MNTSTPSTGLRGLIAAAIFGALASSLSAVCAAGGGTKPQVSVTVKFADLNISNPSGALVLYERIQRAAQGVCSYYWYKLATGEAHCVHDAIANAVAKVNQPALSAVFNAKYKTSAPSTLVSQSR